jgi:hypothetical protein
MAIICIQIKKQERSDMAKLDEIKIRIEEDIMFISLYNSIDRKLCESEIDMETFNEEDAIEFFDKAMFIWREKFIENLYQDKFQALLDKEKNDE